MLKRGADEKKLTAIIGALATDDSLPPPQARPHPLVGDWKGYMECHIAPDWLLIYQLADDELILIRTGTHADLFR